MSRLQPQHRVFAAFAVYAFALGQIFPRLPDVKSAMGVEEGVLGLALIGAPLGTMIALTFATPLLERMGFRRALLSLIPAMSLAYAVAIHAPSPLTLFFLLIPAGLAIGAVEIIINIEADRTEAAIGHRIMNRSHAFWSFGFFGAGLWSGAMAQIGMSPQLQLGLALPITIAATWVFLGGFQPAAKRGSDAQDDTPVVARPSLAILVLVGVTLSAMLLEGASIDWSAIYMNTVFNTQPFFGGLAVATTALSQAIVRYFADSFVDRYAPVRVARFMQSLLGLGVILVFIAPSSAIALLGFALIGAGSSVMFPLAMSAAAQRTDRSAAINVAALAQFAFVAFLLGPPLLGFVAEHIGLRWTFGICLPLVVLSFVLSGALGSKAPKP